MRVYVAGATGAVGFEFVQLAKSQGLVIRSLSRTPQNATKLEWLVDEVELRDACTGFANLKDVDVIVSALGSPVTMGGREKRPYREVDFKANKKLLDEARSAGVGRFLYVAAHVESGYANTAYIIAHEEFVNALRRSGLSYSIIRPTGVYAAFQDFMGMALKGITTVIGGGKARTNPVHQADVARLLLEQLEAGPAETSIGGPQTFTRREIAELPFRILGKKPRVVPVPASVFRLGAKMAGLSNPRLRELLEFVTAVSTTECRAPELGRRRLEDYFRTIA